MQTYLAIDIGASSGRHLVGWLENGRIETREVYRFANGAERKNGHLCWDADGLLRHVIAGLKAAKELGYSPVSIGIDTWAVDFILLDQQGQQVGDMVAYRDERTAGMDAELEKALPFTKHYGITGIAKQSFNTVYQLMAALKEHPEYRTQIADFLLVPEYLSYRLSGKRAHEWTNLSTTALTDASTRTWSQEVIDKAGLPPQWFQTPIVEAGSMLGELLPKLQQALGYNAKVLLPATHDTGSAFMAVPVQNEGAAFLSSGTWSLLGTELRQPVRNEESLKAGFTNEGGWQASTRYLKNIMGMWMLQCIRKETGEQYSYAEMADMAAASSYPAWVDASDNRFLAPQSMLKEVEAALAEQSAPKPSCLSDVLRAVTLGLAVCYRNSIQEMSKLTGRRFTSVHIVGGGSQNATLNQWTANQTGLPVYAGPTEGTALGNLIGQMIATGAVKGLNMARSIIANSFEIRRYEPQA